MNELLVVLHYFFYDGKTSPYTAVFSLTKQAGKHLKDFVGVPLLKANAVITHFNYV